MNIGILFLPDTGHLNPMTALSYELRQRGDRVTMFGLPDVESYAVAAKLDFYPIATKKFSLGSTARSQPASPGRKQEK